MSYQSIDAGATERFFTVVARASGAPIVSGNVNYYLRAKSGANAGKWWRNSDQTWQAAETANAMTHEADGHWEIDLAASPFSAGVRYLEYVKESGDLHIPDARHLIASVGVATGANVVTVTVDDGAAPLESATVRMTNGAESYVATTNASGVCTFALNAATWTVAISKAGYQFTPTTLAVSGAASQTYSMTQVTITPSAAGQTTGYLTCYTEEGVTEAGVEVIARLVSVPNAGTGAAYDGTERTEISDGNGVVQFTGMFPGARYQFKRGTRDDWINVTVPSDAGETCELPSIIGAP